MLGQEDSREREDEDKAWNNQTDPTEDCPRDPSDSPGTEDGELGRSRTRKEVGGCNPVLELFGFNPVTLLDTQSTEQEDLGGRTTK
jgi:hypothetical protein